MNILFGSIVLSLVLIGIIIWLLITQQRLKKQLEEEVKEKQEIMGIVSHDIKAPLNRIFSLTQLISLDDHKLSEAQQNFFNKIHQVVADGLSLIRNMVDYRNLTSKRIEVIPEDVNVSQVISNAITSLNSLAEKKHIVLEYDIPPDIHIVSDYLHVSRIIENLLSNAIKFSPPGKKIHLTLTTEEDGYVNIQIKDEGPGFSEEDVGKLYNKFQKLSALPTAGETSTGLGLFITKTMVQQVEGNIQCVVKDRKGSTFIVTLPKSIQKIDAKSVAHGPTNGLIKEQV